MLALLLDVVIGFFIAKHIKRLWVQIVLAIAGGIASSIVANMLMYWLFSGTFTPGETMIRIVGGSVWHPVITLIALWYFRKKLTKKSEALATP
jgi:hypothetical protein